MALRNRNNHYNQLNTNDTDPRSNMAPEKYQPLNGTDDFGEGSNSRPLPTSDIRVLHQRLEQDPRFSPPPPSIWKRLALIFILFFLLWLGYRLQSQHNISQTQPPKIVHANRYGFT